MDLHQARTTTNDRIVPFQYTLKNISYFLIVGDENYDSHLSFANQNTAEDRFKKTS